MHGSVACPPLCRLKTTPGSGHAAKGRRCCAGAATPEDARPAPGCTAPPQPTSCPVEKPPLLSSLATGGGGSCSFSNRMRLTCRQRRAGQAIRDSAHSFGSDWQGACTYNASGRMQQEAAGSSGSARPPASWPRSPTDVCWRAEVEHLPCLLVGHFLQLLHPPLQQGLLCREKAQITSSREAHGPSDRQRVPHSQSSTAAPALTPSCL